MKRFFISVSSFIIISLVTVSISSFAKKKPGAGNQHMGITYVVTVSPPEDDFCDTYHIIIMDEEDNMIGAPLAYNQGIDTYIFHESGSSEGTRIAYLEKNESYGYTACQKILHASPDEISGKFNSGSAYHFELFPTVSPGYE